MKFISTLSTATLLCIAGTLVLPVCAQENRRGENRDEHRERDRQPEANRQRREAPPRQIQHDRHPRRTAPQARNWQQQRGWQKQGAWQGHETWEGGRATHWQVEHRTWVQRGGYGGYYIPRNNFRLYFGHDHWFRIQTRPVIYMGYPRFMYRNYSFIMVDPWPEDWDPNWYGSEDVYIDYDNGYYLYSRRHPGVAIAVTVVK